MDFDRPSKNINGQSPMALQNTVRKAIRFVVSAVLFAILLTAVWQAYHKGGHKPTITPSGSTWLPDGRLKEGDRRAFNFGADPTPIQTPTPFHRRMTDSGYQLDQHTGEWYPFNIATEKYHCFYLRDHQHQQNYFLCPKDRPPGIPDQKGN